MRPNGAAAARRRRGSATSPNNGGEIIPSKGGERRCSRLPGWMEPGVPDPRLTLRVLAARSNKGAGGVTRRDVTPRPVMRLNKREAERKEGGIRRL